MTYFSCHRGLQMLVLVAAVVCGYTAPVRAIQAPVSLRWEILAHHYADAGLIGNTTAVLRLQNHGPALPRSGWALYFNCASEVHLGAIPGYLLVEHVNGTLFRIRPTPGFAGVPTGASVDFEIEHPEVVIKETRTPAGPYLVFDDAPDVGLTIQDYQIMPPTRSEQAPRAASITAADRFAENSHVKVLPEHDFPPVLPTPRNFKREPGLIQVNGPPHITASAELEPERALVQQLFARRVGALVKGPTLEIKLAIDSHMNETSPEAYKLATNPTQGVLIIGHSAQGVARGVATLQQLLTVRLGSKLPVLPIVSISDAPRFPYRGLNVDVARNFQPKEVVFHLLDLMARHKLNTLHLHLTDDEGWRLAIPGLPELTEVGARRGHSEDPLALLPPAHGSGPDAADPHGSGYYSAADYIAIVRYAAERRIEVVPEIEMPGHARAAVKAMEARSRRYALIDPAMAQAYLLSDPDDKSLYVSAQGYTDNVMNPALESTYHFIEHVIEAVMDLHQQAAVPLRTIHVGGDELPRGAWQESPAVANWLRSAVHPDRQVAWNQFYDRVGRLAEARHLTVAGWEELGARRTVDGLCLEANPLFAERAFHTYVWNDLEGAEDLGLRLANAGYPTVLAPVTANYFDMAYNHNAEEPGATWSAPLSLEAAFDFDPEAYALRLPGERTGRVSLTRHGAANVLGLEGTLWSETMREPARIEYLLLPRMLGLAERAWAARPPWATTGPVASRHYAHAWTRFMNQVARRALPSLDADEVVAYRIPAPGVRVQDGRVDVNHEYPGFVMRYTQDGTDPTAASPRWSGSVAYLPTLRVAAFASTGRHGLVATPGH